MLQKKSYGITHLTVGVGDELAANELVGEGILWRPPHDVHLGLLVGQGDGRDHVRSEVDAEDGDGSQGEGNVSQHVEEKRGDFRDV